MDNGITHERPNPYQQVSERKLQNNSEEISKLYSRVICNKLILPDSLFYTRENNGIVSAWDHDRDQRYLSHAIVRVSSVFSFTWSNNTTVLNPSNIHSLILKQNDVQNHDCSDAFDIYWYKGDQVRTYGWGIKIAHRKISKGTPVATARLSRPNNPPEYRILSSAKGLPEQKITPFWNYRSAVQYLIESSANGQLQLPRVVKTGENANSLNNNISAIRPILIPPGEQYQNLFIDYSWDIDENKKALSRLIQSAIDSQDQDNQKALEWIENLVENGCNYWFNRTLKQMNNTIENNTTCRVLLRESGNVSPESHPKLFEQISSQQRGYKRMGPTCPIG